MGYVSFLVSCQIPSGPITFLRIQTDIYDAWIKRRHRGQSKSTELAECVADVTLCFVDEVCRQGLPTPPDLTLGYFGMSASADRFVDSCRQAIDETLPESHAYQLGELKIQRYEWIEPHTA